MIIKVQLSLYNDHTDKSNVGWVKTSCYSNRQKDFTKQLNGLKSDEDYEFVIYELIQHISLTTLSTKTGTLKKQHNHLHTFLFIKITLCTLLSYYTLLSIANLKLQVNKTWASAVVVHKTLPSISNVHSMGFLFILFQSVQQNSAQGPMVIRCIYHNCVHKIVA